MNCYLMSRILKHVVGQTIKSMIEDKENGYYGLELDNGTIVWVLSDEEGNGSGYLDIITKERK